MIAALPSIGLLFSMERVRSWGRYALIAASIALIAFILKDYIPSRERVSVAMRVNDEIYPVGAADFVIANDLKGNLFNTYFWGGYLIWRLGPERKVFVDGRNIDAQGGGEATAIRQAFALPGQTPALSLMEETSAAARRWLHHHTAPQELPRPGLRRRR